MRIADKLPGVLKHRFHNTLDHISRSFELIEIDREMASFRAITAEEEAATALIRCVQLRKYQFSKSFNARDHQHKAAIMSCVMAIGSTLAPLLAEFQLVFNFSKPRIDVKVPLSNFGVKGGDELAIQFVEPLDLIHKRDGFADRELFDDALKGLAERSQFETIKKMVAEQANARNKLLYASDSGVPVSRATMAGLRARRNRSLALLVITVMIWQVKREQNLVTQAIVAFLNIMDKLPIPADISA